MIIAEMRFTTRLLFTVPVLVFSATATTILNRAKGPLPSFDEPLNLPQDPHIGILHISELHIYRYYKKIVETLISIRQIHSMCVKVAVGCY